MAKYTTMLVIWSLVIGLPAAVHGGVSQSPKAVEAWFKNLPYAKQKLTKLHFYFHDIVGGNSPTSKLVAQPIDAFKTPTMFGYINAVDDPLTVGPDQNSEIIGRAQGFYGSTGLTELSFHMSLSLVFTRGEYRGSSLSLLGWNPAVRLYREMAITGGSGVFRLAQGIATAKTHLLNTTSGEAIVEYHVIVLHY